MAAIETVSKGQAIRKFLKTFYSTHSLIQRNSERLAQPKINLIYKLFTRFSLLYLPFCKAIEQTKLRSPSLNSHENGVLAGCFFKNSKYVYKLPLINSLGRNQNLRQGGIKCFCLHLYKSKISIKTYTFEISFFKKYESSYLCKSCFFIKSTRSNRKIHKLFSYSHLLITCHLAFQFERHCYI